MLKVSLGDLDVGVLLREERTGIVSFVIDEVYASLSPRPVLGQQFEERRVHRVFRQAAYPGHLPTFFANLLPEGALGAMVAAQAGQADPFGILALVGEDLPGAVVVRPGTGERPVLNGARSFDEPGGPVVPPTDNLRFSLAGVQLKFSAVAAADDRFTLPFRGLGGRWILKFGSEGYPGLPENECLTMEWAQASGLNVPAHRLLRNDQVDGLDARLAKFGDRVYAIQRYDRLADGTRVHQEDFAQILGLPPDRKYLGASLESIARFVGDVAGPEDLLECLRRVLFAILCGNSDVHLKNWSLVYPDRYQPKLSPAYDFVCVRQYLPTDQLALPLAKERVLEKIGWEHVARVEKYLVKHGHHLDLLSQGREFVSRSLEEWKELRERAAPGYRKTVDDHLSRLALTQIE